VAGERQEPTQHEENHTEGHSGRVPTRPSRRLGPDPDDPSTSARNSPMRAMRGRIREE
jgi:hypothetical protein